VERAEWSGRASRERERISFVPLMGVEEDGSRRKTLGGGFEEERGSGRFAGLEFFAGIVDMGGACRGERELS
jgi:hypothetical protein